MSNMNFNNTEIIMGDFYKDDDSLIWWIDELVIIDGRYERVLSRFLFSFDKVKIYDYHKDYPHNMTAEEVEIFDKEYPPDRRFK